MKRNHNIEHLISQSDKNYTYKLEDDTLHSIGNLIAIGLQLNSKLQNKHITEKIEILKEEKHVLPEIIKLIDDWGKLNWKTEKDAVQNINKRTKKLAERSFQDVWKM